MRRLVTAITAAAALALLPAAALAHANLVRSSPAANASLQQAPAQVQLWFSERPEVKLTQVQVFDGQRKEVQAGPPAQAAGDPLSLVVPLQPKLAQGVYTVSWKTTSADDGHVTGGAFAFGIGATPSAADVAAAFQATQQPPPSPISVVIRWLEYVGASGLLGLALFGVLAVEPAGAPSAALLAFDRRLRRAGVALAVVLLAGVMGGLVDQAARSGGGISAAGVQAMAGTGLGEDLLARIVLAAAAVAVVLVLPEAVGLRGSARHRSLGAAAAREFPISRVSGPAPRVALAAVLLAELFLFALSSHAQAVPNAPELALANDWLHLTLAGVWVGGLIALALAFVPALGSRLRPRADVQPADVERNQLFGPVIAGFSRVALISAVGLAVTGFYQALVHVGSVDNALGTPYGQTLIVKTAIFAVALLLAGFHRWLLLPLLAQPAKVGATRARRFMSRTLPAEALLVVGVLLATGLLTALPPANSGGSPEAQVKTLAGTRVVFDVVPLHIGPNLFQVTLTSRGKPVDNADKVELRLTMLDMDMGQSVLDLETKGQGVYAAEGDLLSMGGHWQIDLLLRLPGQLDQRTTFFETVKP